ncbi:MAG: chemotaxis-specific protein-glutamate methyltransferase CheB [Lachnospiraceae bacterium]|nr:chemotaxis-specific protein-glutamate methyltransferase CheB [Lachnospiraceae bacterium]
MAKKILTVDDSALMRRVLSDIIYKDPRFELEASAANGLEAYDMIVTERDRFDLIILDINMPKMNGITLMEKLKDKGIAIPVLIVSSLAKEGAAETIRCLELGAFDFITKPDSFMETKGDAFANKVLGLICAALKLEMLDTAPRESLNRLVKQNGPANEGTYGVAGAMSALAMTHYNKKPHQPVEMRKRKLVVICASTGGPKALSQVITGLPEKLAAPVIIIQHMPEYFTGTLAERLNAVSKLPVKEAETDDLLKPGRVYLAKGGRHLRVVHKMNDYYLELNDDPARSGLRPCADVTFESLQNLLYDDITCVVLTGMGSDGTRGIGALCETKNLYVIAQNEESCTVYGMPRVVHESGLTDKVLPIDRIADAIIDNVGVTAY